MRLRFLTAGESHGSDLVAILEGIPAGLPISANIINRELVRRQRGFGSGPRMKIEQDSVQIVSGWMSGMTTGAPIAMIINNRDHKKWIDAAIDSFTIPRPGHADLTGAIKYGYRDLRLSLERASARETAARVAIGAICKQFLAQFGIKVEGYVRSIDNVVADIEGIPIQKRGSNAETNEVRCPDLKVADQMRDRISQIMQARDTLGGVIEVVVLGVPVGLGSHVHYDRKLDAKLGAAMLSVQSIKGVEIGPAFENTRLQGTQVHDSILLDGEKLYRPTNRAGGIEGGISNGQPIVIRSAMKPIATTLTPQQSIDLASGEEVSTNYERSDFCPVPRAVPILEAMAAFVIADELVMKLGGDSLQEMKPRYDTLADTSLTDLSMVGSEHIFWPANDD